MRTDINVFQVAVEPNPALSYYEEVQPTHGLFRSNLGSSQLRSLPSQQWLRHHRSTWAPSTTMGGHPRGTYGHPQASCKAAQANNGSSFFMLTQALCEASPRRSWSRRTAGPGSGKPRRPTNKTNNKNNRFKNKIPKNYENQEFNELLVFLVGPF